MLSFFINLVKEISNSIFKGVFFDIAVFIFAQIRLAILDDVLGVMLFVKEEITIKQ